uniref:Uncharacterized protein n=1 Tax=Anguilla anguilla TaxID=7936 RepID=A0A0E9PKG9_ANGAN
MGWIRRLAAQNFLCFEYTCLGIRIALQSQP